MTAIMIIPLVPSGFRYLFVSASIPSIPYLAFCSVILCRGKKRKRRGGNHFTVHFHLLGDIPEGGGEKEKEYSGMKERMNASHFLLQITAVRARESLTRPNSTACVVTQSHINFPRAKDGGVRLHSAHILLTETPPVLTKRDGSDAGGGGLVPLPGLGLRGGPGRRQRLLGPGRHRRKDLLLQAEHKGAEMGTVTYVGQWLNSLCTLLSPYRGK